MTALEILRNKLAAAIEVSGPVKLSWSEAKALRDELQSAYDALPDSLDRPLARRIEILAERANREAKLACELSARIFKADVK